MKPTGTCQLVYHQNFHREMGGLGRAGGRFSGGGKMFEVRWWG